MPIIAPAQLEDLFRSGRFQRSPTMRLAEVFGVTGRPVEVVISSLDGRVCGTCWRLDLDPIIALAEVENDTALSNPNLAVVKEIIKEIDQCEREICPLTLYDSLEPQAGPVQSPALKPLAAVIQFPSRHPA